MYEDDERMESRNALRLGKRNEFRLIHFPVILRLRYSYGCNQLSKLLVWNSYCGYFVKTFIVIQRIFDGHRRLVLDVTICLGLCI
jgi:hypothetical protein